MTESVPFTSALHDYHTDLGAKMADFGGWSMPIDYPAGGVMAEHAAVRTTVGIFDVSHLGKAMVTGPGAADFLNTILTNDLSRIGPGQAQYTMCCNEAGGVVDDLIAYLVSPQEVFLIPNAANTSGLLASLHAAAPADVSVQGQHHDYAVIAVQGPRSPQVLAAVGLPADHSYMTFVDAHLDDVPVRVCRSGYTGERGYELVIPSARAGALWTALTSAVDAVGGMPCGLGARDTLRTEMGYNLHGQDLSPEISPVMARTGWAVGWNKPHFWGKEALSAQRDGKVGPLSRGLVVTGRGIPRAGCSVRDGHGALVGSVTSGTFSPTLKQGIALALIDRGVDLGDHVSIEVRGRGVEAVVVKPPFIDVQNS